MITVLLFLAVLFVLVLVHEWGHYIVAKKTGMRVDEFGIGFPPRLFGVRRGETEYTLNALPLGGFVRIYGEALVHGENEERDPDHHRAMWARPRWAQALVLVAGVVMNVVLAWCLYVVVFLIGPTAVDEMQASESAVLLITSVLPASPLHEEIIPGTQLVNIAANGTSPAALSPRTVTAFIQEHPDTELIITVRDTETATERVITTRPVSGLVSNDPERVAIGVGLSLVEPQGLPFFAALSRATAATWYGLTAITAGIGALLGGLITGGSDLSGVAGPVGIAGMVGDAAALGITPLFMFVAIISLNLAVINLLPFPALDGGRLLLLLGEVVFRRPANQRWVTRLNAAGFILLMVFMLIVTYNDIVRIFSS
jgi:regulator of sigma E protease